MRKKLVAAVIAALATIAVTAIGFGQASTPPGQRGYEGQPGNQGGYHQSGQTGYEGQPGNQSNGK